MSNRSNDKKLPAPFEVSRMTVVRFRTDEVIRIMREHVITLNLRGCPANPENIGIKIAGDDEIFVRFNEE